MSQPSLHHKVSFFSRSRRASNSSWRTIFQCFFPWVHLNYHVHLSQSPPFFMVTGNTNAPSIPCALSAGWSDSKLPRLAVCRQKSTSPRTRMQWRRRRRPPPPPPEAMSNCRTLQLLLPYIAIITTTIFMSYSIVRIPHPYIQHAPCILPATFPASNCLLRDSDTWRCLWRIVEGKLENGNEVAHGKIENVIQTQTNGQRKCFSFQNAGLVPKRRHRPTASTIALLSSTRLSAGQHYEQ